jgi:hypothetical protein
MCALVLLQCKWLPFFISCISKAKLWMGHSLFLSHNSWGLAVCVSLYIYSFTSLVLPAKYMDIFIHTHTHTKCVLGDYELWTPEVHSYPSSHPFVLALICPYKPWLIPEFDEYILLGSSPIGPSAIIFKDLRDITFQKPFLIIFFPSIFKSLYIHISKRPNCEKKNLIPVMMFHRELVGWVFNLVIVTMTILESIWIIICRTSISILESVFFLLYLVVCLTHFQCFFFLVCSYLVMNFSNECPIHWYFV